MEMLHHISLGVRDIEVSARFYDAVLSALGYVRVWSDLRPGQERQAVGYGLPGSGDKLALKQQTSHQLAPGLGFHLAFAAPSRDAVHRFHEAAVQHGGEDNGAPGLRAVYGERYYAAFVVDPDGHRLEAVINEAALPSLNRNARRRHWRAVRSRSGYRRSLGSKVIFRALNGGCFLPDSQ